VIEQRLRASADAWFPETPSVSERVLGALPPLPDEGASARPRRRRRILVVALALLAVTGTALAATALDLVPGVRVQRVDELPEVGYQTIPLGDSVSIDEARSGLPFELLLPDGLGEPDTVLRDRDRAGAPVVTAIYAGDESARLVLTQWPASTVLFDKLVLAEVPVEYVDVHGAEGVWIEGGDHAVFYLGRSGDEDRVGGLVTGNVLVWHRGRMSYRLELGVSRERALELAGSLRPTG
jgi:hypothetical protein